MSTTSQLERSSTVLTARFVAVERAAVQAGERIPSEVNAELQNHLDAIRDRMAVGVDSTVVALVGGTGSGKSALFNVLTGVDFATVGVKRPTTAEPLACVWGNGAEDLLDHLGISENNRYQRESELDAGTEEALRGLVLVDVPDHDSIAEHHRAHVDRIVPRADVLIWVLDPQKYADAAVHRRYLQELGGHESSLMVVLNKIDTVPEVAVPSLLADIEQLLTADGLEHVPVRAVSTRSNEGVSALREVLAELTQTRSAAAVRAAVDLRAAGDLLAPTVAKTEPDRRDLPIAATAAILAQAADVSQLQAQMQGKILSAHTSQDLPSIPSDHAVDDALIAEAREKIISPAQGDLPQLWAQAVAAAVPLGEEISGNLRSELQAVPLPEPPTGLRRARQIFSAFFLLVAILAVGWGIWLAVTPGNSLAPPSWDVPWLTAQFGAWGFPQVAIPVLAVVIALVLGVLSRIIFGARLRRARDARAQEYGAALRAAAAALVGERMVSPVITVHHSHREVREVIEQVQAELAGKRPHEVVAQAAEMSDPQQA